MLTIINQNFSPDTPKGMDENRHLKMLIDDISEPREGFFYLKNTMLRLY